ncbi:hypothetical protein ACV3UL_08255 [Clostridium perfringens]
MKDYLGKDVKGIKRFLNIISVDRFKKHLEECYSNINLSEPYSDIVTNRCRQSIGYVTSELIKKGYEDYIYKVYVCVGYVNNNWHCWLYYNDYFIDMTYCQFDSSFPEILIIKASAAKKKGILNSCTEYPLFKWLEKEDEEN